MHILWIQAKNFKCYNDIRVPSQGVLPEGLLFVEGENSTGKSSLFDAILYAFFYDPTTTKELGTKDDLIRRGFAKTEVEVAFELDDKYYLVKRSHGKKEVVQAFLLKLDSASAKQGISKATSTISEGVVEVEKKILTLLNINKDKAFNTLIVRQGSVQDLAEAKGAELRNIIYELFQLDLYREKAIDIIKSKIKLFEVEQEKYKIDRTTENIQEEIESTKDTIESSKKVIEKMDSNIERLQIEASQFPIVKELQVIDGLTQRSKGQDDSIKKKTDSVTLTCQNFNLKYPTSQNEIEKKNTELEKEIEENKNLAQADQKTLAKLIEERAKAEQELENFANRKKSLERISEKGEQPKCDVCQQQIDEAKFKELLEISRKNIPILTTGIKKKEESIRSKREEISEVEQNIQDLIQNKGKLDDLANDLLELEELINAKEKITVDIQTSLQNFKVKSLDELANKYGLSNFSNLFDHVKSIDDNIKTNTLEKKHLHESIKEKHENISKLENQIEENKKREEKISKLDLEISLLTEVQTLVEKFIAEELISNKMLANIQEATRAYIFLFTRGRYSELYLEPTKTKTLNMSIKDEELGFVKSQTLLSGGDKAAIGLGLRIGISELLKRIRPLKSSPYEPPKMDILVLDEPLGSLDEERRSKVIEGLVAEKKFSQIFLITHTNIRRRFRAPIITVQTSSTGSVATFHESPTTVEVEAEE